MAIYAAVIDRLDQSIGRLVDELKAKGVYDNTFSLYYFLITEVTRKVAH